MRYVALALTYAALITAAAVALGRWLRHTGGSVDTPFYDDLRDEYRARAIDAAVADFAAEVEALADVELRELTEGER